ncbi:tRNA (guanine-N(7)-)-methyltransferase [Fervidicella metallireducens AeB]|uniref:tRNA (guanine-N(7)-)-methyltransferase n=1 Tax=Fervidicella metallireducens AeB TaxID=1403537 RepID=A0A017RT52_9CLOT|nr:tRNA (guanosine(46)-N7)-methyltransferase TrmB [Fervidicella metallireducens]EYE87852.1 tRNA (guanine-N(7)-)-methyltransferase [Fervidicella metallireducens AeB]
MRLRKKHWARPELEACSFVVTNQYDFKGRWLQVFGNNNDIYLELGCGRGKFISENAINNPDINYIGIDLKDEVLVAAKRTVEEKFKRENKEVNNIKLIPMEIAFIENVFDKNEISRIYINFCNPWPKLRHNKRRLTHTVFLNRYKKFLKPGAQIWFKTDDTDLFNDSQEYFKECGFSISYLTYDLHKSDFKNNIMTEYETKFTSMGLKTMFLIANL